ncbi:helix-turn-helix domain-containing protein [Kitasatospora sp. NPDC057965]|uniref:helix-turn-helix domain-containing protein n=1 Tax=Kitasatospora sp. NPDC057965 TaxID=3346291 RepID=UPI0036DB4E15
MPHAQKRAARSAPAPSRPAPQGCACSPPNVPPLLHTAGEAAAILKVSPATLRRWRREGRGPAYVRVGGRIGYRHQDLAGYLAASLVVPKAAA